MHHERLRAELAKLSLNPEKKVVRLYGKQDTIDL